MNIELRRIIYYILIYLLTQNLFVNIQALFNLLSRNSANSKDRKMGRINRFMLVDYKYKNKFYQYRHI